jgi:diguanylate cyclase (GGDEF)-like protein
MEAIRQKLIDKAYMDAILDALTNLGNRRMLELYHVEFEKSISDGFPICVAILDIDFFKRINDTFGHATGDKVLQYMANSMRESFRKSDLLIRWGGEEFLIILRYTGLEDARALMEKFRLKMQSSPMKAAGKQIPVCLTIGLKEHRPFTSIYDSIKKADELMYQGKVQGRNRVMLEKKQAHKVGANSNDDLRIPDLRNIQDAVYYKKTGKQ